MTFATLTTWTDLGKQTSWVMNALVAHHYGREALRYDSVRYTVTVDGVIIADVRI